MFVFFCIYLSLSCFIFNELTLEHLLVKKNCSKLTLCVFKLQNTLSLAEKLKLKEILVIKRKLSKKSRFDFRKIKHELLIRLNRIGEKYLISVVSDAGLRERDLTYLKISCPDVKLFLPLMILLPNRNQSSTTQFIYIYILICIVRFIYAIS